MSACDRYREWNHARLDGDLDAEGARALDAHLEVCASCRDEAASFDGVAAGLRRLRPEPMPDAVLETVLERTARANRARVVPFPSRRAAWIGLAAAALVAAILVPSWLGRPDRPSADEVARARRDAQFALAIVAKTIRRAETAGDRVLTDEVSPALRRIPIRWQQVDATTRRDRT